VRKRATPASGTFDHIDHQSNVMFDLAGSINDREGSTPVITLVNSGPLNNTDPKLAPRIVAP
jgi:hypothetical protein